MSIWSSMDLVSCHVPRCDGCGACGGLGAPFIYHGSHVMPEANGARSGQVDCGWLSKFVRHHRDNPTATDDPDGVDPWMRFSVNEADVILDRAQVTALRDGLDEWLAAVDEETP